MIISHKEWTKIPLRLGQIRKFFEELSDEELEYAHKYAVEKEKIYLSEQLKKGIHGR